MSARSHRHPGGSRAGLVAVASAAMLLGTLPLTGSATAATSAPAATGAALGDPSEPRSVEITVTGTVTDAAGRALPGLCVGPFRWYDAPECTEGELTDAQGDYRRVLEVPSTAGDSGGVWVEPAADDEMHQIATAPLSLAAGNRAFSVDLRLPLAGVLTGRALDDSGKPVTGACPQVRGLDATAILGASPATCSDAEGVWRLARVPVAPVAVALIGDSSHQGAYVGGKAVLLAKAARYTPVAGKEVSLPDTSLTRGGTITVRTDKQQRGVNTIVLHPVTSTQDIVTDTIYSTVATDDLSPIITNVQEGSYLVEVQNLWDPADCPPETPLCSSLAPWWAPGTADPGKAKAVKIQAGATIELQAEMKKYRRLALKFRNIPKKFDVGVVAYFPSGKAWEVIGTDYLPPSPMKLQFAVDQGPGKRRQWWSGNAGGLADALLIGEDVDELELDSPVTITDEPTPTSSTTKVKTTKVKTTKVKTTKTKTIKVKTTKVKTTKTKGK
ncbi:MAG: hypothetical protein U0Q15_07255 [Kineosporiaceae bacterium]